MNKPTRHAHLWICLPLVTACASSAKLRVADGLEAERLEIQVDEEGQPRELEYHIDPAEVPEVVHAAMNRLHPGGSSEGAEKEYEGTTLYWELSKRIAGRKVEAMFHPDGSLHSEEIEVAVTAVPEAVRSAVDAQRWGAVTAWEEIRNSERELVEYHVKTTRDERRYKLLIDLDGRVTGVYREIEAEIELPIE